MSNLNELSLNDALQIPRLCGFCCYSPSNSMPPPTPCLGLVVPIPTPVCCYDTSPLFVKRHRGTWRPQAHFLTQHLPCEPQHVIRTATHSTNTDHKLLCSSSYSSLYENNKIYFIITTNNEFNVSNLTYILFLQC